MGFFAVGDVSIETMYANPAPGGEDTTGLLRLTQMIEDAPVGAKIRATIFRLNFEPVRDALVAANNRGTPVYVMHNGRDQADDFAVTLAKDAPDGLGHRHRWSGKPFDPAGKVHDCGAIATGPRSDMHTKLVLFSATKDPDGVLRENVSWWGSGNPSQHSGTQKSNNAVAVYGDAVLYENFRTRLWNLIWAETHFPGNDFYNARLGRGMFMASPALKCKVFCSPEQTTDLWVNRLDSVVVSPETTVDVAHARFQDGRAAVADQLVRIHQAGGTVRVAVGSDPGFLGPRVQRKLLDAGIPLRLGSLHDKLVLVHSRYGVSRRPRKVVFNGSHNLNYDANYLNDEVLVKMFNDEVYDDMLGHFERLWEIAEPVV